MLHEVCAFSNSGIRIRHIMEHLVLALEKWAFLGTGTILIEVPGSP